jgi:hypothetical protein
MRSTALLKTEVLSTAPRRTAAVMACLLAFLGIGISGLLAQDQPRPESEADQREWLHTLGDQTWDFRQLAAAYKPLKGEFDLKTGQAVWTLELMKDLSEGEVAVHSATQGSPFRAVLLDADKVLVSADVRIKLGGISGKAGDAVRVTFLMPAAEKLSQVKTIRIERRTQIGF